MWLARTAYVITNDLLQMKRINMVACEKNMQTQQSLCADGYIFHFSINPQDMKAVEKKNRREMNFFSQGCGEDYRDLLESVAHRRRAGEIISDCMGTKLHMYTTNYKLYFSSRTEEQAVQKFCEIN